MIRWTIAAALCCAAGAALGQPKDDVDLSTSKMLTTDNAIVCASPFRFADAAKALLDKDWMREINCVWVREQLPVTLIEPYDLSNIYSHGQGRPWRVRLTLPSGGGTTVYVQPHDLVLLDGRKLPSRFW